MSKNKKYYSRYDHNNHINGDEDTSGFVDIKNFYNKATDVKVKSIDKSIELLKDTMTRYIDDCVNMWNDEIVLFSKTRDCMILKDLTDKNCIKFLEFMKSQKSYRIMTVSLARLEAKKDYILKHSK